MHVEERAANSPLLALDEADQEFVVQFVLSSGSLKDMARAYGVSYPTLRTRLDRLIARLQEIISGRATDSMSELLASLIEQGEMTLITARRIQDTHRRQLEQDASSRKDRNR